MPYPAHSSKCPGPVWGAARRVAILFLQAKHCFYAPATGTVPALDFHHKVKTHAGQTKKTTGYPMVPHIYCPFSFRSLFVFEGSRQRTFLGCIQKRGMGMQRQSCPDGGGGSSAWGQCHAVKVIICCSTQQRTGR